MNPYLDINEIRGAHWMDKAACSPATAHLFFPEAPGPGINPGHICRAAKEICDTCPVTKECLEFATMRPEQHGVWGGMSFNDRKDLRRGLPPRPRRRPGHCIHGHDLVAVGLDTRGDCQQCRRDREARYAERRRQGLVPPRKYSRRNRRGIA